MDIQVRNRSDNTDYSNIRNMECRVNNIGPEFDPDTFAWGFEIINSPAESIVRHSVNTLGNVFLNYDSETPQIELTLSELGAYQLKIVLQYVEFETRTVTNMNLDADGNLFEVDEEVQYPVTKTIKSETIELDYVDEPTWI